MDVSAPEDMSGTSRKACHRAAYQAEAWARCDVQVVVDVSHLRDGSGGNGYTSPEEEGEGEEGKSGRQRRSRRNGQRANASSPANSLEPSTSPGVSGKDKAQACHACGKTQGVVVRCEVAGCALHFHASCAANQRLKVSIVVSLRLPFDKSLPDPPILGNLDSAAAAGIVYILWLYSMTVMFPYPECPFRGYRSAPVGRPKSPRTCRKAPTGPGRKDGASRPFVWWCTARNTATGHPPTPCRCWMAAMSTTNSRCGRRGGGARGPGE